MSAATLELEDRLDLRAAGTLADSLLDHRGADLVLDAARVEQIGALAVQAIRAAARSWAQDGHALTFVNASNDLADQLALLGFRPDTLTQWEAQT
jgi:chemotaxis protein CheX